MPLAHRGASRRNIDRKRSERLTSTHGKKVTPLHLRDMGSPIDQQQQQQQQKQEQQQQQQGGEQQQQETADGNEKESTETKSVVTKFFDTFDPAGKLETSIFKEQRVVLSGIKQGCVRR